MKYSIFEFCQSEVIKIPELDLTDLLLLQYVKDALASPTMQHKLLDENNYVWLYHEKILQDLPILSIKNNMLSKRLKKLVDLELLLSRTVFDENRRGSKAFYTITKKCESLYMNGPDVKNYRCSDDHMENITGETLRPDVKNYTPDKQLDKKDKLLKNNDNININFLGSNKKQPKQNLYSKALALIDDLTDDLKIRNALRNFLDLQLEIYRNAGKTFYINVWKSRLNKLKNEFSEKEWLEVIQYATSKGWQNFYPIPANNTSNSSDIRKGKAWEENVKCVPMTDDEREADECEADRLEAMGIKMRF